MGDERLDLDSYQGIGVIKNQADFDSEALKRFELKILEIKELSAPWDKEEIVEAYLAVLPELSHEERGKYLDARM